MRETLRAARNEHSHILDTVRHDVLPCARRASPRSSAGRTAASPRKARQDLSEEEPVGLVAPPAAITGGYNDYGNIVEDGREIGPEFADFLTELVEAAGTQRASD